MAETNKIFNYLSLTGLQKYDANIKGFIEDKVTAGVANSFKFVNLVDGELRFYTVNPISEDTVADYAIELPEQDLSHLMQLVKDATAGNVAVFGENGQVVDTGIKAADLATKSEVETAKGEVQASVDELAELVGELPEGTSATSVVDYVNIKTAGIATDTALEELNNQVSGLQTAVQGIQEDYLVEADKTELAGQISDVDAKADENAAAIAEIAGDYLKAADKTELEGKIKANTDAIGVLNGEGEGSVKKAVDDAINKFATDVTNDEVVNSYKELIDWAAEHGGEAAEMAAAIAENATDIEALEKLVGALPEGETSETIVAFIQKLVNAEVAAREAADGELDGKITALGNKVAGDIATAKGEAAEDATAKANKALEDAKKYADEKVGAIDLSGIGTNAAAIEELKGRMTEAETDIADINSLIGDVEEDKTVVEIIGEAVGAEKTAREGAIATLTQTHEADKAEIEGSIAEVAGDVAELAQAHADDKVELQGGIADVAGDLAALEASLQEISIAQINEMFGITE